MKIPIKKILIFLSSFMVLILSIHILLVYLDFYHNLEYPYLTDTFHLNKEENIPTWFSSFLLLLIGFFSLAIVFLKDNSKNNSIKRSFFWKVVGLVYIFISVDEVLQIHERINLYTDTQWIYIYAPFAFSFIVFCFYYLIQKKLEISLIRNLLLIGMAVQFMGAFVAEYTIYGFQLSPAWYQVEVVIEEGFEMLGSIIVLAGVLNKINNLALAREK